MGTTFYQKVKKALKEHGPITYAHLADEMEADSDHVRLTLGELRRRGLASAERNRTEEGQLWRGQ